MSTHSCSQVTKERALSSNIPQAAKKFIRAAEKQKWPAELMMAIACHLLKQQGVNVSTADTFVSSDKTYISPETNIPGFSQRNRAVV